LEIQIDCDNIWVYQQDNPSVISRFPLGFDIYENLMESIIKFFENKSIKTTFFIVGLDSKNNNFSKIIRRIIESGHKIGNHSYSHPKNFCDTNEINFEDEIRRMHRILEEEFKYKCSEFRAPGYCFSDVYLKTLCELNYFSESSNFPGPIPHILRWYFKYLVGNGKQIGINRLKKVKNFTNLKLKTIATYSLLRIPIHPTFIIKYPKIVQKLIIRSFSRNINKYKDQIYLFHAIDFSPLNYKNEAEYIKAMELYSVIIDKISKSYK